MEKCWKKEYNGIKKNKFKWINEINFEIFKIRYVKMEYVFNKIEFKI